MHVVCYGVDNFDFVKPCRLSISTVVNVLIYSYIRVMLSNLLNKCA